MDSEYLHGGFARQKEIEDLKHRLLAFKDELMKAHDEDRGMPRDEVEKEIAKLEAQIRLLTSES